MVFFSNFFNFKTCNIKKLEQQASDVIDLDNNLKAFRIDKNIVVVDSSKNKIICNIKDTFSTNNTRASLDILKQLNSKNKISDIWTCGFRDKEERWVWYRNSEPVMTTSFKEAYKENTLEDKVYFFSARYGTNIIEHIKKSNIEKVCKEINGFILENSYVKVSCNNCLIEENYTIDDLVDENKNSSYSSNFVVCQHCNRLIKLI